MCIRVIQNRPGQNVQQEHPIVSLVMLLGNTFMLATGAGLATDLQGGGACSEVCLSI